MGAGFRPSVVPGTIEIDLTTGRLRHLDVAPGDDVEGGVRHQCGAAEIGGRLTVYGGDDPGAKVMGCGAPFGQAPVGEVWVLDPDACAWRRSTSVGPKLKRTVASTVGDSMYVFGGYDFDCVNGVGAGQVWNTGVVRIAPNC